MGSATHAHGKTIHLNPSPSSNQSLYTERKQRTLEQAEQFAFERERWKAQHAFYYEEEQRYWRFLVPNSIRVLELGCSTGDLLAALKPSEGLGIDFSQAMIDRAKVKHSNLHFERGDVEKLDDVIQSDAEFDVILMQDTIGALDDCLETFRSLHRYCQSNTRIIVSYHSRMWEPFLLLYTRLKTKELARPSNWLSSQDIVNLLDLAGFDVIKRDWRVLCPFRLFGIGRLINRYIATLPLIRKLCLRNYVVARPYPKTRRADVSTTVVVPCRNERGNIDAAIVRMPQFCSKLEVIFVEGNSTDGTWEKIQEALHTHRDLPITIKAFKQVGHGKGDAVRLGFSEASGDILMILDADLTMPPEDLPKFYETLVSGKGEFINGSRLVYPMEKQAMRFLNLLANYVFALLFTYLLNQRYTDTLCGTKALGRHDYENIIRNRQYFGDFDPFGDFDLIFGASKLNLKTVEVPIRYAAREYGQTNISRFRHGLLLLRMAGFAFLKMKAL
ncbi:MAG: glycosyltransferase [Pseudolabrys sp.]|nr:glycosyltransferase [Pseudolabrys sp.]